MNMDIINQVLINASNEYEQIYTEGEMLPENEIFIEVQMLSFLLRSLSHISTEKRLSESDMINTRWRFKDTCNQISLILPRIRKHLENLQEANLESFCLKYLLEVCEIFTIDPETYPVYDAFCNWNTLHLLNFNKFVHQLMRIFPSSPSI